MAADSKWQKLIDGLERHLGRSLSRDEARVAGELAEEVTALHGVSALTFSRQRQAYHALASGGALPTLPSLARAVVVHQLAEALSESGCGPQDTTGPKIREFATMLAREADKRCCKGRQPSVFSDVAYSLLLDFYYCCIGYPTASRSNHASRGPSPLVRFLHAFIKHLSRDVRHWLFTTHGEPVARLLPSWRTELAGRSVPYMRRRLAGCARPLFMPRPPPPFEHGQ